MSSKKLKFFLLPLTLLGVHCAPTALANNATIATNLPPATYIMQVSSNLECDTLQIQLVSEVQKTPYEIEFGSGAFSGLKLPAGKYTFGKVNCKNNSNTESLDLLSGRMSPFILYAGQTFYAGRLILKEIKDQELSSIPKELDSCTRSMSRARGDSDNSCRDGVGIRAASVNRQVNVYLPEESDEEISKIQSALNISEDQFVYLPLRG